jgi:hypothetical protein
MCIGSRQLSKSMAGTEFERTDLVIVNSKQKYTSLLNAADFYVDSDIVAEVIVC